MKAAFMNGKMRQQLTQQKEKQKLKSKEATNTSSNHVTFSSISLLAPGRFRGLGELGVSLDWNGRESAQVKRSTGSPGQMQPASVRRATPSLSRERWQVHGGDSAVSRFHQGSGGSVFTLLSLEFNSFPIWVGSSLSP